MARDDTRIALLYEHPEWFKPLFAELDSRGIRYDHWAAHDHLFDPHVRALPYRLVVNRMSPSAYLRGHGNGIFYTLQLLSYLRDLGVQVVNGYDAFRVEVSKTLQTGIFEGLGLRYPRTRIISSARLALQAAEGLQYPIVIKPNIGGSGAGIRRFDSTEELDRAAGSGEIDLGIDSTALVQEFLPAEGGSIVRVEVLNGRFLYAIRIRREENENFNLCPADICQTAPAPEAAAVELGFCPTTPQSAKRRLHIERANPPAEAIAAALRIADKAHLDVGGIEYLTSERDGQIYFYDVNALSNFVTDAETIVGFNPYSNLAEYILDRAAGVESCCGSAPGTNAGRRKTGASH
jgi:hypothetical protein